VNDFEPTGTRAAPMIGWAAHPPRRRGADAQIGRRSSPPALIGVEATKQLPGVSDWSD